MPSPFPGMDPYLEGYLWPDVHHALAAKMRQQLTPLLRPRYTARLAIYMVEDVAPEGEIGRVLQPIEVQIITVEIRDTAHNRLVTCIEILSPVNKREPGLTAYRQKRQRLYHVGVHLIELDLLRRGTRPCAHPRIPEVPYVITLVRAHAGMMDVWPLGLRDTLPIIPVPLRLPDAEILLDLPQALQSIYEEAAYDLSIDYRQAPPPPPCSEIDRQWMRELVGQL